MLRNRPRLNGFLIGLAVTALGAVFCFQSRLGRILELQTLDMRFRNAGTLPRDSRIVHVDIDDNSLDRVGRWPWRRRDTAALVRVLHELGASVIAIDLLLDDRQRPTFDDPRLSRDVDIEPDPPVEGEFSVNSIVDDDLELADAIRSTGNVFISMHMRTVGPRDPAPSRVRIRRWYEQDPRLTKSDVLERLRLAGTPRQQRRIEQSLLRERIRQELLKDFTLAEGELARRLQASEDAVFAVIAGVKTDVANERVAAILAENPRLQWKDIAAAVLGDQVGRRNADRADLKDAYRSQRGLAAVRRRLAVAPECTPVIIQRAVGAESPYYGFVEAARGVGAVNFDPDIDTSVRRIPLAIEYGGGIVKHLSLAMACAILGVADDQIEIASDHTVRFPDPGGGEPWVISLDRNGQAVINWARDAKYWRDGRDFPHISAAKPWAIVDARRKMRDNETAIQLRYAEVVGIARGGRDEAYRTAVHRANDLARAIHQARLEQRDALPAFDDMAAELSALREQIERSHTEAAGMVELTCSDIREEMSVSERRTDPDAKAFLHAEQILSEEIPARRAANERLRASVLVLQKELAGRISDKIVFLGYAATALGDIVSTPIDPITNGVMCHAHMLNTLLQKRPVARASRAVEVAIVFLIGTIIAGLTATGGPRRTLVLTLGIMTVYTLVDIYVVFARYDEWVTLGAVLVSSFVTWAMVTLFRQLTAERERRFFSKQLGQYTSPAIAARIAESPEAARLFKSVQSREVTCLFTDLAAFTTLSEQEDDETIQYVLNTYLERMSEVIWRRRGLINKFMGDGIMAFFNASVDPQADHAANACTTALDAMQALEDLKSEQARGPGAAVFQRLRMRAGLATGVCKNGDFGSELKADYTVIGDTVNLAARLEPANKVFGTGIMISDTTRRQVEDAYEFRYLADLQVKGKTLTVPVFEIVCRKGELAEGQHAYIKRFEAGVEIYKNRKWDDCIVHFTRLLARKPDDAGAARYIEACQEHKRFPPDDDWNGALELKEK
ncbi:MAG: CHASE2 domain-containing protein [Phycisphaerae bacterium]